MKFYPSWRCLTEAIKSADDLMYLSTHPRNEYAEPRVDCLNRILRMLRNYAAPLSDREEEIIALHSTWEQKIARAQQQANVKIAIRIAEAELGLGV